MDFKQFAKNALNKAKEISDKTIDYGSQKLLESSFTISSKQQLDSFIKKSTPTKFTNKETGIEKEYSHRVIVIFGDENTDFFKKSIINFPVLSAKAFSQNISIKLAKKNIDGVDYKSYNLDEFPGLVVFENEAYLKTVLKEENILKLVKSLSLDINKSIDEIDSKQETPSETN